MDILRPVLSLCWESTGCRWILNKKGQQCRALVISLLLAWSNNWEMSDLRPHNTYFIHISQRCFSGTRTIHGDVTKWKHFTFCWPFVRGIQRWPVDSPHKSRWRGALMFSLICTWKNGWANSLDAGYLRRHSAHYDVTVMHWGKCAIVRCNKATQFQKMISDKKTIIQ